LSKVNKEFILDNTSTTLGVVVAIPKYGCRTSIAMVYNHYLHHMLVVAGENNGFDE
jgi:hypothetical protein